MDVEIRPAGDSEMAGFKRVAKRSLLIPPEMAPPEAIDTISPEWTLCAFENGTLATSYAWWPLKMRFNGTSCPVAGITYVSTNPVCRRRGYLRRIIAKHFEMMHEKGQHAIAALHPSRAAIYHRYGYAVVSSQRSYAFDPRELVFTRPESIRNDRESLREAGAGEKDVFKEVYRRFCQDRTGYIHRGNATWDAGALAPPSANEALFKIVYEENGEPLGYVLYTARTCRRSGGELQHQLVIRDFVWLTPRACQALWRYFSGMDLANEIKWMRVPPDDPLPHLVNEPRDLHISSRDGLMARIVDIAPALTGRRYDTEGSIRFELIDELCPWNRGRWVLETGAEGAELTQTKQEPEIILPVDTLAMLLFGQISPSRAGAMGRLEVALPGALPVWDRLFATRHQPFCPDFF